MALFYFDRYSEGTMGKALIIIGIISGVILTVILNTTTPATAGAFGILLVFICTYLITLSIMTMLLTGISKGVVGLKKNLQPTSTVQPLRLQKAYYYATILSLAPVIVVSMQSVGGVGVYELGLIGLLIGLGCLYVSKRVSD
jgi:hypothetical protein